MSAVKNFYGVVGPRTSGFKSIYTKQRMTESEKYMSGIGGHAGHRFISTPSNEMYVVRQTTFMDQRLEAGGLGAWFKKMQTRWWVKLKFYLPGISFAIFLVIGIWEAMILEAHRYERLHYY